MLVRIREMRESVKIIKQALERLEPGPVRDPNPQITPPPATSWRPPWRRSSTTSSTTPRASTPKGEVYVPTESARGELGYYIVSDGGSMPYRVKVRAPSFVNLQSLPYACKGSRSPTWWPSSPA